MIKNKNHMNYIVYSTTKASYHTDKIKMLQENKPISPTHLQVDLEAYCNDSCVFCAYRKDDGYNNEMLILINAKPGEKYTENKPIGNPTKESGLPPEMADKIPQMMVEAGIPAVELSIRGDELVPIFENGSVKLVTIENLISLGITQSSHNRLQYSIQSFTLNENNNFTKGNITDFIKHKQTEPLYKIVLKDGRDIVVTKSHSIFFYENNEIIYKPVRYATQGDLVVINNANPVTNLVNEFAGIKLTNDFCRLLGFFVAEGSFGYQRKHVPHHIQFTLNPKETKYIDDICSILKSLGYSPKLYQSQKNKINLVVYSKRLTEIFLSLNTGYHAQVKRVPDIIFNTTRDNQIEFLKGLFAGDGNFRNTKSHVNFNRNVLSLKTSSKQLQRTTAYLLDLLGVRATFREGINNIRKIEGRLLQPSLYYTISISNQIDLSKLIDVLLYMSKTMVYKDSKYSNHSYKIKRIKINDDCFALPIERIEILKAQDEFVYDISVANTHKFESSFRILCHNTGGGEPTLWHDFDKLLINLIDADRDIGLVTNGSNLTDTRINLLAFGATWVRFSMDSDNPTLHQKIHRTPILDFERRIENIKKLIKARNTWKRQPNLGDLQDEGLVIGISFITTPDNYYNVEDSAIFYSKLGVDHIRFSYMYDKQGTAGLTSDQIDDLKTLLDKLKEKYERDDFKIFFQKDRVDTYTRPNTDFNTCYMQRFVWAIGADNLVYPCCIMKYNKDFALGDIRKNTLKEIIELSHKKMTDLNVTTCYPCWLRDRNISMGQAIERPPHANFI